MLEELRRRCPELHYDLDIIEDNLEPISWEPMSDGDKRIMRAYFESKAHLHVFSNQDINGVIQDNVNYNEPSHLHERSDSDLINRMVDGKETPQGRAYMTWLGLKYFPDHIAWKYPNHDLDLTLDEARDKYDNINDIPWL